MEARLYNVDPRDRGALLEFMVGALERCGCRITHRPPPDKAPFRITFEDPQRQRLGIIAYAFTANTKRTRNRPEDEHRFQLKYGTKDGSSAGLWRRRFSMRPVVLSADFSRNPRRVCLARFGPSSRA